MGRLVDIDEVIRIAKDTFPKEDVRKIAWVLCHTPTAYDVSKVVAEIKRKYCKKCRNILGAVGAEEYCKEQKCEIDELCDIVRKGGVE